MHVLSCADKMKLLIYEIVKAGENDLVIPTSS